MGTAPIQKFVVHVFSVEWVDLLLLLAANAVQAPHLAFHPWVRSPFVFWHETRLNMVGFEAFIPRNRKSNPSKKHV